MRVGGRALEAPSQAGAARRRASGRARTNGARALDGGRSPVGRRQRPRRGAHGLLRRPHACILRCSTLPRARTGCRRGRGRGRRDAPRGVVGGEGSLVAPRVRGRVDDVVRGLGDAAERHQSGRDRHGHASHARKLPRRAPGGRDESVTSVPSPSRRAVAPSSRAAATPASPAGGPVALRPKENMDPTSHSRNPGVPDRPGRRSRTVRPSIRVGCRSAAGVSSRGQPFAMRARGWLAGLGRQRRVRPSVNKSAGFAGGSRRKEASRGSDAGSIEFDFGSAPRSRRTARSRPPRGPRDCATTSCANCPRTPSSAGSAGPSGARCTRASRRRPCATRDSSRGPPTLPRTWASPRTRTCVMGKNDGVIELATAGSDAWRTCVCVPVRASRSACLESSWKRSAATDPSRPRPSP